MQEMHKRDRVDGGKHITTGERDGQERRKVLHTGNITQHETMSYTVTVLKKTHNHNHVTLDIY